MWAANNVSVELANRAAGIARARLFVLHCKQSI